MESDEEGTRARLRSLHAELIDPKIESDGGRIVKTTGDGILVEFPSAVDAVRNALTIQSSMAARYNALPEQHRLIFRIGINVGDVIVEGEDIHGDGVNVAARLEGICEPGHVYVSGSVFDQVDGKLGATFQDLGERNVKNIEKPIRVFCVSEEGARGEEQRPAVTESGTVSGTPSIAVLPFTNLSGDPDQEFFADGLTEDLITALSHWRTLPVIARNSTFVYKNTSVDIRHVAEELGAGYVVEGSVRKSGNRIRVTAQLIEGTTGHHLLAENLDRDLEDIFELQDDLTQRIAAAVMPELEQRDILSRVSSPDQNLDAWSLLHKAVAQIHEHRPEGFAEAREILEQAIKIDRGYARAYAWMGYSYIRDVLVGAEKPSEELWNKATSAARHAINLDDLNSLSHFVLGLVYFRTGQHDLALAEQRRAMELNPNLASAHVGYGQILAQCGRAEEGIQILERGLQLNPRDPRRWVYLDVTANAYITAGNFERAAELAQDSIQRRPENAMSHLYLAVALGQLDRVTEARTALTKAQMIDRDIVGRHGSIRSQKFPEDNENFLEGLRKAGWEG
jgi:adenylate cyclase